MKLFGIITLVMGMMWNNFAYSLDCSNIDFKRPENAKVAKYISNEIAKCARGEETAMDGNLNCESSKDFKSVVKAIKASFPDLENEVVFFYCLIKPEQQEYIEKDTMMFKAKPQWPSKVDFECLNMCKTTVKGMTIGELNSFCMMRCSLN